MGHQPPATAHRKALRAAAIDLHRIASDIRDRRGLVPADDPPGHVDALATRLRSMARLCEGAKDMTCAEVKRAAITTSRAEADADAGHPVARRNAVNALLNIVNQHALKAGLDPFEGMRPSATQARDPA